MPTFDCRGDCIGGGGRAEWLCFVGNVMDEEVVDLGLQLDERSEDAAVQFAFSQPGEEAIDRIQP